MHNCTNKSNNTCWRAHMSLDVLFELHIYFPLDRTVFSELSSPVCLGNTEFIAQHYSAWFSVKPCTGIASHCIALHCNWPPAILRSCECIHIVVRTSRIWILESRTPLKSTKAKRSITLHCIALHCIAIDHLPPRAREAAGSSPCIAVCTSRIWIHSALVSSSNHDEFPQVKLLP